MSVATETVATETGAAEPAPERGSRRSGGREARRALRSAPLADDVRPIRPGLEGGNYRALAESDLGRIHEAVLTRPRHLSNTGYYGADPAVMNSLKEVISPGYEPEELGHIVVRAVQENQLYIIPYAEFSGPMQERLNMALAVIPDPKDDPGMAAREAAMARRRAERAAQAQAQKT